MDGQTPSNPTDLVIAHFKKFRIRAHNLSVDVKIGKVITLCSSEWPALCIGWPAEGTFHLPTVLATEERIFQKAHGHPDPYIVVWKNLLTTYTSMGEALPFSSPN